MRPSSLKVVLPPLFVASFVSNYAEGYVLAPTPTTHNARRFLSGISDRSFFSGRNNGDELQTERDVGEVSNADLFLDTKRRQQTDQEDSVEKFAEDIATVLKLRPDLYDPTIPKIHHIPRSFTNTWTVDVWKKHRSRWRFVDYVTSFPTSRILRRIAPQLGVLLLWSIAATHFHTRVTKKGIILSLEPLSIVSSFVAALLVLRSNQGLGRLNEARTAMGDMVLYTRDLSQFIASNVYPKDPILALKAARHIALFPWLLKGFLRGKEVNGSDEDIIRVLLPPLSRRPDELSPDAAYVLERGRKRPSAAITRLRQIFSYLQNNKRQLTTSESSRLDPAIQQINRCIMVTERIQASPIPPVYTAHSGRLVMIYLFHLPIALHGLLDSLGAVSATMTVAFAMLGLDEISHMTEEPFRLMPLYHISKNAMKDCGDAMVCVPPPLFGKDYTCISGKREPPPYWNKDEQ